METSRQRRALLIGLNHIALNGLVRFSNPKKLGNAH